MRFGLLPIVLIICGAGLSAMAQQLAPPDSVPVAQIDFDALRQQAAAALTTLQGSPERRIVSATTF